MNLAAEQAVIEYKHGKTIAEIAVLTGLTVNQVRIAIRKARKART